MPKTVKQKKKIERRMKANKEYIKRSKAITERMEKERQSLIEKIKKRK